MLTNITLIIIQHTEHRRSESAGVDARGRCEDHHDRRILGVVIVIEIIVIQIIIVIETIMVIIVNNSTTTTTNNDNTSNNNGGFKGSATKGRFRKRRLTALFPNYDPKLQNYAVQQGSGIPNTHTHTFFNSTLYCGP